MHNENWDDLRFVLAVAESGSVSAAARELGVNHATVLRRIAAFEACHGAEVFERAATGYRVRPDRVRMIEAARGAAQAMGAVGQLMQWADDAQRDMLRLTSTDTLCATVLADLPMRMPRYEVSLLVTNGHLDLARLQADVALRPAHSLPSEMAGRLVGQLGFAAYVAAARPQPEAWIGLAGPLGRSDPAHWMQLNVDPSEVSGRADSFVILREMVAAGAGRAILPCILGDGDPRLARERGHYSGGHVPLWVCCHRDLAESPRLRPFIEDLSLLLKERAAALSG